MAVTGANWRRRSLLGMLGLGSLGPTATLALARTTDSAAPVAVLYPDLGEPYRGIFFTIIEGIEQRVGTGIASVAVAPGHAPGSVAEELKRREARVVIALGRQGVQLAGAIEAPVEIIAAGIIAPGDVAPRVCCTFSLAPDPGLLFARLKTLSPASRRVTVVHDPRQNAWLIRLAQQAARQQGLELRAFEATDLRGAAQHYQQYFAAAAGVDALWLLQDSTTVDESTILPMALKSCWNQNLVLFSSSLAHVRRGALFSLYPNHLELGRQLGASAAGILANQPPAHGVTPLREVMAALNVRTANHLGLKLGPRQQQAFDLLLPEQ